MIKYNLLLARILIEFPSAYAPDADGYFEKGKQFYEKFKDSKLVIYKQ